MIVRVDGRAGVAEHMRCDAELLGDAEARAAAGAPWEAVLRLFRFDPSGVTLGHAQHAERELDLERCARDGVAHAKRPTGGRAIFHAAEWTYSLTAAIADPEWGGGLAESYDRVSRLVCASLVALGAPVALASGETRERAGGAGAAAPCFASTARHEIVRDGRKVVGSAQRRTAHALLQQGSVLLGGGHLALVDYLAIPDASRAERRAALAAASADLGDVLGADAPLERWAASLRAVLAEAATGRGTEAATGRRTEAATAGGVNGRDDKPLRAPLRDSETRPYTGGRA
jgi:lipoyl(octanoyl) transferase